MISTKLFKSLFIVNSIILTCSAIQVFAQENPPPPTLINIVEGQLGSRLYKILSYDKEITWDQAKKYCSDQGQGWQLTEIFSPAENQVLKDLLFQVNWDSVKGYKGGWTGLYEPEENQWQWVSGKKLDETFYKNWGKETKEPSNHGVDENCGTIEIRRPAGGLGCCDKNKDGFLNEDGWWNDAVCDNHDGTAHYQSAICQKGFSIIIIVNSPDDNTIPGDGWCTLREAIENANNGSDTTNGDCVSGDADNVIYFAINGVINLKSELIVNSNIDFEGPGADKLTISGQESTRVFSIGNENHVVVSIEGITIANGSAGSDSYGGGIYNANSDITIVNSILLGNSARYGGAIFNEEGTVKVINSSILGDNLKSAEAGGGIYNGDLVNPDGSWTIEIINSTLSNNKVTDNGGAIYNIGKLTINNSTLSGNQADNKGGGIYNSTWSGNLSIKNSTLSANKGGGIFIDDEDTSNNVFIANTIVANNDGGDCYDNNSLTIKNTLIRDGSCNPTWSGDPLLGTLANNGGPTKTHALLPDSPAIDKGDDTTCAAEPINNLDQRGKPRTGKSAGVHCDIGAFELQQTSDLVELINFTATPNEKNILFNWETRSERHSAGFYLWQAEPLAGNCKYFTRETQLTGKMIPSQGSENSGFHYEYPYDGTVDIASSCYGLEEREISGKRNFYIIGTGIDNWETFFIE